MNKVKRSMEDYIVRLSDGHRYCLYPSKIIFGYDAPKVFIMSFKVKTIESVQNEDFKSSIVHHKEIIPANTELEVTDVITNLFGRYLEVLYNNSLYYIDPSKVEYSETIQRRLIWIDI